MISFYLLFESEGEGRSSGGKGGGQAKAVCLSVLDFKV
jgi:hypothetical protein